MTYHCAMCAERWTYADASIGRVRFIREHEDAAAEMAERERAAQTAAFERNSA